MFGFSSSKASSTNRTETRTSNVDATQNEGLVLSGASDSTINVLDGGAIAGSLNFASGAVDRVFDFGEEALDLSGDSLKVVTSAVGRSVDAITSSTRAVLSGNQQQIAAINGLAESVSVGDRETSAKIAMMLLAVVGLIVAVFVFMVLR